jgi:sugar lactone lactonase YvrE
VPVCEIGFDLRRSVRLRRAAGSVLHPAAGCDRGVDRAAAAAPGRSADAVGAYHESADQHADFSPNRGRIKPQGVFTATTDPAVENVLFFGNWVDAKRGYKAGQKIGRFRVSLEVTPPRQPNCEVYQDPLAP